MMISKFKNFWFIDYIIEFFVCKVFLFRCEKKILIVIKWRMKKSNEDLLVLFQGKYQRWIKSLHEIN